MKQLLILGAGGMGKDLYNIAKRCIGYGTDFIIKGFLDFPNPNWNTKLFPPILGIEDEYEIQPDDVFTCSIGDVSLKRRICDKMKERGARFKTLICTDAHINETAVIGEGCIIDNFVLIGSDAILGENCLIQANTVIGHDAVIGNNVRIDCNVVCVGGIHIGNNVCIHTSAVINHGVKVGDGATVGAMSFVIRNVKPEATVFGCPAKLL